MLLISCLIVNLQGQYRSTSYGTYAGNSGNDNSSFGYYAGDKVIGDFNNSIGSYSGFYLTSGNYNTFSGYRVGLYTSTATWNTFVGAKSATLNTSGSYNVFLGSNAGYSNTTSNQNVYIGYAAGFNSTGAGNVFIGYLAGYNEIGGNKLLIANSASNTLISGDFNTKFVGIGTNSPVERFQIGDRWTFHDGGSKVIAYNFQYSSGDKRILQDESSKIALNALGEIEFAVAPSGSAGSTITWTSAMDIQNNGKIGINTNSIPTDGQVAINGKLYATEVEIQTYPWSDYVFNKDYELLSLNDLENYIETQNHLPEVPSAEEIKQSGMNLGEMNALLLKKIEELTLYIIAQNKKILEIEKKLITE